MIEPTDVAIDTLLAELRDRLGDSADAPTTLRGLLEAVLVVGSGLELDSMLQRIVSAATSLLDARYGALGMRAADGGLSEFVYVGIHPAQREVMGHLPEGRGILGLLINDPRPVRLGDLSKHSASIGFPPNHPPMKSFLGTPIMVRGKVFGSIYLTEKLGAPEFTEEDEVILKVLAMSAGVAVENARLFADISWSTDTVADATRARASEIGLDLVELEPWYDVDDAASLRALIRETGGYAAPETRAVLARLSAALSGIPA